MVLVSIIFWKFVVSMKLLILPFASGMIGSSGENLHSPSTMNLYLNRFKFTDADHAAVALLTHLYYSDHKLVALLLQGYGLLPFVERTSQQYLIASVVPGESSKDI